MTATSALRETLAALGSPRDWGDLVHLEEVGSTNAVVRDLAPWSVVVAERQVAGRGRLDRVWEHVPGMSIALSVRTPPLTPMGWVPLAAGLAVHDTVRALGLDVGLKWPNDVLWVGEGGFERKIGGLLCEGVPGGGVVVGIGLNVGHGEDDLPVPTAGSLRLAAEAAGVPVPDREAVLPSLLLALRARVDPLRPAQVRADYLAACRTLGSRVEVHRPDGTVQTWDAVDVDTDGRLVVCGGGRSDTVTAGDVRHVRHRPA